MRELEWTHKNKEWQKTLDTARRFGWTSKRDSSHGGMTLLCPKKEHKIRVYSTGANSENVARASRGKIEACEHRDLSDPIRKVETGLNSAELWLGAAAALLDVAEAQAAMQEALDLASEHIDGAERAFDEASRRYDLASKSVEETNFDTREEPVVLLTHAGSHLREAELILRPLPRHTLLEQLRERLDVLKSQRAGHLRRLQPD